MTTPKSFGEIREKVIFILNKIAVEGNKDGWSDKEWTKQIKKRLCKLGQDYTFEVCTHQTAAPKAEWPEWLYDITWLTYSESFLIDVPLVSECEWSDKDTDIIGDFEKILIANTDIKLMIFQKANYDEIRRIFSDFKKRIHKFKKSKQGERYIFAGYDWEDGKFKFDFHICS